MKIMVLTKYNYDSDYETNLIKTAWDDSSCDYDADSSW